MVNHEMPNETSIVAVVVALLSLAGTLTGSYFAQRRSTALISYRLEQLEQKVNKHNNLIERTYRLEEKCALYDEKIRVANHRIEDLEKERDKVS
jgi:type VI protein secretion system component VasK